MRPPSRDIVVPVVLGLLAAIVVGWVLSVVNGLRDDLDDSDTDRGRLERKVETTEGKVAANQDAAEALAQQVERLGGDPVVDPDGLPEGVPGRAGKQGPPPSPEAVDAAVRRYCAAVDCQGPRGPPGESITTADVAAAVATYCDARGECIGPPGTDGQDGTDGASGADGQDGAPGPPPSDQQVLAAVATYCDANGGCRGPPGTDGQDGASGPPGPQGEPGPTCPDGWVTEQMTVVTDDGTRDIIACVPEEEP